MGFTALEYTCLNEKLMNRYLPRYLKDSAFYFIFSWLGAFMLFMIEMRYVIDRFYLLRHLDLLLFVFFYMKLYHTILPHLISNLNE